MLSKVLAVIAATLCIGVGSVAFAGPGGTQGSGHFGGASANHVTSQELLNSNGPNSLDRDTGLERAEDRMNQQGLQHEKADWAQSHHKQHKHHKPIVIE